ncbi:MAG: hypothetical protein EBX50_14470 [Chitinophagia bacterium]|nr:hypothetical protein [Chitinophagia bacterium]
MTSEEHIELDLEVETKPLFNFFLNEPVHELLRELSYEKMNPKITFTVNNPMYFSLLVSEANATKANTAVADNPFNIKFDVTALKPIVSSMKFAKIVVPYANSEMESFQKITAEMNFLIALNLAFFDTDKSEVGVNDVYYVCEKAGILYDPVDGLFTKEMNKNGDGDGDGDGDRVLLLSPPFAQLCLSYILPGMYWERVYALLETNGVESNSEYFVKQINDQIMEIKNEWFELRQLFSPTAIHSE